MQKRRDRFGPAAPDESIVFGAAGPGAQPEAWLKSMQTQGMRRVCCLVPRSSSEMYGQTFFGRNPGAVRAELFDVWSM
jgi:hypothetical protein